MNTRALLLAASCLLARRAAAEPEPRPTLLRLSATPDELYARRTAERAAQLERVLARLPEVERAHVELTLPNIESAPLDRPLPRPRALVMIEGGEVPERDVATSAHSLLGGDVELTLVQRAPRSTVAAPLVRIGPFEVSSESASALQGTLVGLLTSNVLLAGLLVWRTRRDRPREPKVDPRGRSSRPP